MDGARHFDFFRLEKESAIDYCLVIPARLASSRLPGKPLADIAGKPMIQRTYEQVAAVVPSSRIVVATDSKKVQETCNSFGAQSLLTSDHCLTGTDRVAAVASKVTADFYINVQGDEPLISPLAILRILEFALMYPDQITNGWAWIKNPEEFLDISIPKVVLRSDGRLLYMSRAGIPSTKHGEFVTGRKQICVYGLPREALLNFASQPSKGFHEDIEDIEILRFLELGYEVHMIEVPGDSIAVDTPQDLEAVRSIVQASQ